MAAYSDGKEVSTLLTDEEVEVLQGFAGNEYVRGPSMAATLSSMIEHGVADGRFTEDQATKDLYIALAMAKACKATCNYEAFWAAVKWLGPLESEGSGCAEWYRRYGESLAYSGKASMALEFLERGAKLFPQDAHMRFLLSLARYALGDSEGAAKAVDGIEGLLQAADIYRGGRPLSEALALRIRFDDSDAFGSWVDYSTDMSSLADWMVCDRAALSAFKDAVGAQSWSSDNPHCTFMVSDRAATFTLEMNEAFVSRLDPKGVTRILSSLDGMIADAAQSLSKGSGDLILSLKHVSVRPDLSVRLVQSDQSGSERIVDFDADLQPVLRHAGGPFVSMVLLKKPKWDPLAVLAKLRDRWGIALTALQVEDGQIVGSLDGNMVLVSMVGSRIPGTEIEEAAQRNYMDRGAMVAAARSYRGHLIIAVVNNSSRNLDSALDMLKLTDSCIDRNCFGVYRNEIVYSPAMWSEGADGMLSDKIVPWHLLVWPSLYADGGTHSAVTTGMKDFCLDEVEAVDLPISSSELFNVVCTVAGGAISSPFSGWDGMEFEFNGHTYRFSRANGDLVDGPCMRIELRKRADDRSQEEARRAGHVRRVRHQARSGEDLRRLRVRDVRPDEPRVRRSDGRGCEGDARQGPRDPGEDRVLFRDGLLRGPEVRRCPSPVLQGEVC